VDAVLDWLRLPPPARPRLITLYFSDVDHAAHRFGPLAPEARDAFSRVDAALGRLLDGIQTLPIRDDVFVVLVSDHGMAETSRDRTTALDTLIDLRDVVVSDAGPTASLHVRGGPARARQVRDELNARLRHGRAYLRADVPERLHYRADPRIGDVVIVMEEHYMVYAREREDDSFPAGMHGWDPALPSMHGIFIVSGPGIRKGATVDAVENIDIYPFLAELLGIEPAAGIDGRPGRISGAVSEPDAAGRPVRRRP
jgi:predicted AlkP superfamily pyrophosphatase or phosphodiesterase